MLAYKKFDYNGQLDCSYVFLLGLMYSIGNSKSKSECLFKFFDRKNEGQLPNAHIKQIFSFFFEIAVIVVPAIQRNKSFEEYKEAYEGAIAKSETMAMKDFKKSASIVKEEFKIKMMTNLQIMFQPGGIRKEIEKKTPPAVLAKTPL